MATAAPHGSRTCRGDAACFSSATGLGPFENGAIVPLKRETYIAKKSPKLRVVENQSIWHLTSRYQLDVGEEQREFRRRCYEKTNEILETQTMFSEMYVSIKTTKALREIYVRYAHETVHGQ